MKKLYVVFLLTALTVSSCDTLYNEIDDSRFTSMYSDIPLYYGDFSRVLSPCFISAWMRERVTYESTRRVKYPEETLSSGSGDCDCYALLYMNIMYVCFGIKCDLALVNTGKRHVVAGGKIDHAVVRLPNGTLISAQSGAVFNGKIRYIYYFDEVFSR
jgi:hypothetical protein